MLLFILVSFGCSLQDKGALYVDAESCVQIMSHHVSRLLQQDSGKPIEALATALEKNVRTFIWDYYQLHTVGIIENEKNKSTLSTIENGPLWTSTICFNSLLGM